MHGIKQQHAEPSQTPRQPESIIAANPGQGLGSVGGPSRGVQGVTGRYGAAYAPLRGVTGRYGAHFGQVPGTGAWF